MSAARRSGPLWIAVLAILATLIAVNTAATFLLGGMRFDLTSEGLYSLSPGVQQIVSGLDEPVRLDFYWTAGAGDGAPQLRGHAQRVREFLEELAALSNGKVQLTVIDPEPFSEAEDAARSAGVAQLSVDGVGGTMTLGLVVRGATDAREVLPYLAPEQEQFLEYEIARAILAVGRSGKQKVGLLSTLPTEAQFDPRQPDRPSAPPVVFEQMRSLYEVVAVDATAEALPEGIECLVVVHPRGFGEKMLEALRQWVAGGKPLLLFFDPWCETDPAAAAGSFGGERSATSSDLGPLPAEWGFTIPTDMAVGDLKYATRVRATGPGGTQRVIDYVVWLGLSREAFVSGDPITGPLSQLNMMSVGQIKAGDAASGKISPLIESSTDSQLIQTLKLGYFGQPDQLARDFKADGERKTLAARVGANMVLIADADLLSNQTWIVQESVGGISLGARVAADNGALVLNALESLVGGGQLSSLRGRGHYRRPFDKIEALRKDADARYLRRSKELEDQIKRSEQKIAQLQRSDVAQGGLILSPEQERELVQLNLEMVEARKELRQVQHQLREEIEATGRRLMLLNVVAWPVVVAVLAFGWTMLRSRRRGAA